MRRSLSKIPYRPTAIGASFSTAGGGGRGRGAGAGATNNFQFTVDGDNSSPHGHGRGRGAGSSPVMPSFFNNNGSTSAASGRGRGFVPTNSTDPNSEKPNVRSPFSFAKAQDEKSQFDSADSNAPKTLPSDIFGAFEGTGRGKPANFSAPQSRSDREKRQPTRVVSSNPAREQLNNEEKARNAVERLSRGEGGGRGDRNVRAERGVRAERRERGVRERGERGERGRGRGMGRARGRGRGDYGGIAIQDDRYDEAADEPTGQYYGDRGDEELVAKKIGTKNLSIIADNFLEMSRKVLPTPMDEALVDAYETNLMIECEPEFFMGEFLNPDIDEKPPMSLREALEKTKPFFMAYEGIKSQEEWEEIVEETMKTVPMMKEVVDHYGGPDRATAKQQNEELERVAKTLPASTPNFAKRFAERAALSLQV